MVRVVLDLVERVGQVAAGATVPVPVPAGAERTVAAWCAHSGNELVSIDDGVALIRRGPAGPDQPAEPAAPGQVGPGQVGSEPEVGPTPAARLWLYTNFDCNLACDYCCARSSPQAPRRALGAARVRRLVAEGAQAGISEVFLTGGEPFLLPDLPELVLSCVERMPTTLLTNGMLFQGSRLARLRQLPRTGFTLQISLDSAAPGRHDRHRGAGTWRRAHDGIRIALAEGFRVRVAATVAPGEGAAAEQADFHELLGSLGVPRSDQLVRPVAQRGFAADGVALTVQTLVPELTVTADGVYWHPVGADHPDQLVTRQLFPLADAVGEVRRRFAAYRRDMLVAAQRFPCA